MKEITLYKGREHVGWWEVLLMFFLLAVSGNPYMSKEGFKVASAIIPIVYAIRNYQKSISYRTILIFIFLLGYEMMHAIMFKQDYTLTFFKLTLVLLLGLTVVNILKDRFITVLTRTMVIISLVSFVFVLLCYIPGINKILYHFAENLFPLKKNWDGYSTPTLLIFTFHPQFFEGSFSYVRNAGIFWESGAFAVFLNVTLFLHYSSRRISFLKDLFDRDSILLIIALITTTSTMGLIAFIAILAFFSSRLKTAVKYVLIALVGLSSYLAFSTVDFLGEKVKKQLSESGRRNNRFGSALMDFEDIAERPILGWSRRIEVVFGTTVFSAKTHRPNGLTNFLRSYGLVYFTVYFTLVFLSFNRIHHYYHNTGNYSVSAFGILLLLIVSFSEVIFDLAFFKALIFLYSVYIPSTRAEYIVSVKKPNYFFNQLSPSLNKNKSS